MKAFGQFLQKVKADVKPIVPIAFLFWTLVAGPLLLIWAFNLLSIEVPLNFSSWFGALLLTITFRAVN